MSFSLGRGVDPVQPGSKLCPGKMFVNTVRYWYLGTGTYSLSNYLIYLLAKVKFAQRSVYAKTFEHVFEFNFLYAGTLK